MILNNFYKDTTYYTVYRSICTSKCDTYSTCASVRKFYQLNVIVLASQGAGDVPGKEFKVQVCVQA